MDPSEDQGEEGRGVGGRNRTAQCGAARTKTAHNSDCVSPGQDPAGRIPLHPWLGSDVPSHTRYIGRN